MSIANPIATRKVAIPGLTGATPEMDSSGAGAVVVEISYVNKPQAVTDNFGNVYAERNQNATVGVWICENATTGPGHVVTASRTSTGIGGTMIAAAIPGVKTSGAYSSPGGTSLASASQDAKFGVDVTTPESACMVLMALGTSTSAISAAAGANGWTIADFGTGQPSSHNGALLAYKIFPSVATVPAAEIYAAWAGATGGNQIAVVLKSGPATPVESITVTTPVAFELHQRVGSTGSIQISFSTTGSTEDIEASFNGGTFQTIKSAHAPGAGTGTLTGQSAGQGPLVVRKKTTTTTSATVAYVGIGDIFVDAGDSRRAGFGANGQAYVHVTLKAVQFKSGVWSELTEAPGAGTDIPLLATHIMASQGVPVGFIRCGVGSTDVAGAQNQWSKPGSAYSGMVSAVNASTVSGVRGVLMFLGPNAIVNSTTISQAAYRAALDTLALNVATDLPGAPKLFVDVCGEVGTMSPPDRRAAQNNIRGGVLSGWINNSAAIKPGPVLIDQDYTDNVHLSTDSQFQQAANREWPALNEALYGGAAGSGRGPQVVGATWNGARTQITVSFSRPLKTGLAHATQPWTVTDNGASMTISSVAYDGSNPSALIITVSAAAAGPEGTSAISFGSGDDAVGRVIPLSTDIALPGSGTVNLPAEPVYDYVVAEVDATAPTLSDPTAVEAGASTATVGATTNEGTGALFAIVTTDATPPTDIQVEAGQTYSGAPAAWSGSIAVSSTGAKTTGAVGLLPSTVYYSHLMHKDAAGNRSNVVTSASFTTDAPGAVIEGEPVVSESEAVLANINIAKVAFLRLEDMANVLTLTDQVTDADGMLPVENAAFIVGEDYLRVLSDATGANTGCKVFRAS
ncbi:MAG TPA: sialate O-acetylesterase [Roseateles sp.]